MWKRNATFRIVETISQYVCRLTASLTAQANESIINRRIRDIIRVSNDGCDPCGVPVDREASRKQSPLHLAFLDPRRSSTAFHTDAATRDLQRPAPWTLLYADDVMLASEQKDEHERQTQAWSEGLARSIFG
ncbi:hypothetical protein Y032_0417g1090 [Ancylostoma ceylanicum]|uniref:Reverse transcriptase domain-containing protein n=1 Tax=Ancylostoma ceylanicum TaxID=53326 RepID=A0A016X0Z5_9BILA|nr:hypothetical protein Y032_0417g1090 [Ancylostoma ceylanicum]